MIVFLHVPKTAGSTFQFILENTFGFRACHTNHAKKKVFGQADFNFAAKLFPGLQSIAGHNLINPLDISVPNPFYITFVRDPVARAFSQFQDGVIGGNYRQPFEETVRSKDSFENLQVKLIAGEANLDKAKKCLEKYDFVGLTEKFDLSLRALENICPRKLNLNYTKRRVHKDNSIKKSLEKDNRMIDIARDRNKLDCELYAFAVGEIFPKLCARAGLHPAAKVRSLGNYTSEKRFNFVICQAYNMIFYRQMCKLLRSSIGKKV